MIFFTLRYRTVLHYQAELSRFANSFFKEQYLLLYIYMQESCRKWFQERKFMNYNNAFYLLRILKKGKYTNFVPVLKMR